MSGDVQPRKRKDKKRKKDETGLEEHRGTSATFGEGDVQMHSQHEHGTGGHWCAKIIFFSLLAVLVTLIGLIILENRGLSELEANAVESQYSGILEGWIEDTPEDDHHDEHTLELKHHEHNDDDDDDGHGSETDQEVEDHDENDDNDDDHDEEIDHDEIDDDEENDVEGSEDESKEIDDDEDSQEDETEREVENDDDDEDEDDEIDQPNIRTLDEARYGKSYDNQDNDDDDDSNNDENQDDNEDSEDENDSKEDAADDDDDRDDDDGDDHDHDDDISDEIANNDDDNDEEEIAQSVEYDEGNTEEAQDDEDEEEHEDDHEEEEAEEEIEKIEKEVLDQEEPESEELPLSDVSVEKEEETSVEAVSPDEEYEVDDTEFLEVDDLDEPAVERIEPPPPGKPYVEIEEVSTETPQDTLAAEEEYEKQQEELRQQEAQSSHMWLKLAVGGALLAATHAVIRRATAPRDTSESEQDEHANREETPLTDRRMTLISEETSKVIPPQSFQSNIEEEIVQKVSSVVKAAPVEKQDSEELDEDVVLDEEDEDQAVQVKKKDDVNKELYSDEEEDEVDEDVDEEEELKETKEPPKSILKVAAVKKEPESKPEEEDDVEIIDDDVEEEVEEEVEDEEEISDVDDAELLNRLEAKYGRLPEPERPGQRHKDGGNSLEDEWPGEPSDPYWREQLDKAEHELRQGSLSSCEERTRAPQLAGSARARWLRARALDAQAEARRDNGVLSRAILSYKQLLEMNEQLSDEKLLKVALRTIDRIQFRGAYLNAEPVYRLLIRRFPNDVTYRNNLTISFLMANRADLAVGVLEETLRLWPNDRVALAHYGFVLKTVQSKLEESVTYFQRALEGDSGPANEPRFYYHLGDALLMLGRRGEADEVHNRGAALGHFLSPSQRSLYNVPRLKSQPWWDIYKSPYANLARRLESSWREILKEGEAARALYETEKEGLRERGEWSQLDLWVRGQEIPGRCARTPVTCGVVRAEPGARCRRGQVKFSLLSGGTHVRAHVGPTNCRLRVHLALSNTARTYIRVDQETRQWEVGKVLMFDDSFEHEVWHNGSAARLVLIVDVWHPDLTPHERRTLPPI